MKYAEMTPEQKQQRNRSNAASRQRYEDKTYTKVTLRLRQDGADGAPLEAIKAAADAAGQSVNAWIVEAIKERLTRQD